MNVTVVYDSTTGDMLATLGDHDPTKVKAESFEVPDGPKAVTSETPVSWQAQLEAAVKRSDEKRASLETRVLTMFNDMMRGDGADEDSEGTV